MRLCSEVMNSMDANINMYNAQQIGYSSSFPSSGAVTEAVFPSSVYNSFGNAVKSESGLTYNNSSTVLPMSRKRSRDNYSYNDSFSFLGQDVSFHIQQQQLDIEHLIMQRVSFYLFVFSVLHMFELV